jgi:hypothetical protein
LNPRLETRESGSIPELAQPLAEGRDRLGSGLDC